MIPPNENQNQNQDSDSDLPEGVVPIHSKLREELLMLREVHLRRMNDDIFLLKGATQELKAEVKEHRVENNQKLDKLDGRIWWLLGMAISALLSVVVGVIVVVAGG